jgi:hypothetical protein
MIGAWILFPLVLAVLALGCGLLLEAVAGRDLPGALLLPVGYSVIVVAAQLPAQSDATAEFGVPLVVALAVAGLGLRLERLRRMRPDPFAAAAALAVFAAFAAPVVASGEATLTGYLRLDDTASWLGIADRVLTHGTSLHGLAPSSYEAMLDFYLGSGYPVGGLLPLGIAGRLSGQDLAWVYQPHMAMLAVLLALGLWQVASRSVPSRPLRALVVFVAAQPATLFGYTLWGGFKELATAALLPTLAALGAASVKDRLHARQLIPLATVAAGLLGILSVGGAVWLLPMLLPVLVWAVRELGGRSAGVRAAAVSSLVVAMALPAVFQIGFLDAPAASTITTQDRLANLFEPLSPLQLFGIWPVGDFRLRPDRLDVTWVLVVVLVLAAIVGLVLAWRAGSRTLPLYVGGTVGAAAIVYALGSPWVDAKALSIASPAPVLAAGVGVALVFGTGRRVEACVAAAAIAGGVLWSNVLAYRDATIAPHDRLAELATIDERFGGGGPTLMTEFEPYGARYFLRDMDPEVAGELRRRQIPLRNGALVAKGETADIDEFDLRALLTYRSLVLRRSPVASRPPSVYARVWSGRFYDVWRRPAELPVQIVAHLPLGDRTTADARPRCADVERMAADLRAGGRLIAAPASGASVGRFAVASPPGAWAQESDGSLRPLRGGELSASIAVPQTGRYRVWVGGRTRASLEAAVDGRPAGSARAELSYAGQFIPYGTVDLQAGSHTFTLRYSGANWRPGSVGSEFAVGPPALSLAGPVETLRSYSPRRASRICSQRLDWIEAVEPAG